MSEMRKDPLTGRWVILAPERLQRPNDYKRATAPAATGLCPFCPGHEDQTPHEILALRDGGAADAPGWSLRVIPNRYPALRVEGQLERTGDGLFDRTTGIGAHEVIIESPEHDRDLGDLPLASVENVLVAWGDRLRDLAQDIRLRSAIVFKNVGEAAGASLVHPHSQLLALPVVPGIVGAMLDGARAHYKQHERCLLCDVIRQERHTGTRVVWENESCVALAPWAPRAPFETWILPKNHASHFEHEARPAIAGIAEAVKTVLQKLNIALEKPAYNMVLQSGLMRDGPLPWYHWHLEVVPSVTTSAGFEMGSGYAINPVPPEESAAFLRRVKAE